MSGERYRRWHSRGELPRMFERFHRVQGARGRSHEGSGIGLALVQELVKLHGGSVAVRSTGAGARPSPCPSPAARSACAAAAGPPEAAATASRRGAKLSWEEALRWLPTRPIPGAR